MTPATKVRFIAPLGVIALTWPAAAAGAATTLDYTAPPGANYDVAQFRLWYPDDVAELHGVVLLIPGSNGDARSMTEETLWRDLASHHTHRWPGFPPSASPGRGVRCAPASLSSQLPEFG